MDEALRQPHRKRVKHFEVLHGTRMLTFSCYRRLPLLTRDGPRRMLSRALERAITKHGWLLHAFVFMPEHVHLLVRSMRETCTAPSLLAAIKRPTSFRVKLALEAAGHPLLTDLTIQERAGGTGWPSALICATGGFVRQCGVRADAQASQLFRTLSLGFRLSLQAACKPSR